MNDEPIRAAGRIAEEYTHVWDQEGAPMGTVHEIVSDGDGRVTFRERWTGRAGATVPPEEITVRIADAVHVFLNMTPDERKLYSRERTQAP